jgi:hypothetical protein
LMSLFTLGAVSLAENLLFGIAARCALPGFSFVGRTPQVLAQALP